MNLKKWIAIFLCCASANQNAFAMELSSENSPTSDNETVSPTAVEKNGQGTSSTDDSDKNSPDRNIKDNKSAKSKRRVDEQGDSQSSDPIEESKEKSKEDTISNNNPTNVSEEKDYYCRLKLLDILQYELNKKTVNNCMEIFLKHLETRGGIDLKEKVKKIFENSLTRNDAEENDAEEHMTVCYGSKGTPKCSSYAGELKKLQDDFTFTAGIDKFVLQGNQKEYTYDLDLYFSKLSKKDGKSQDILPHIRLLKKVAFGKDDSRALYKAINDTKTEIKTEETNGVKYEIVITPNDIECHHDHNTDSPYNNIRNIEYFSNTGNKKHKELTPKEKRILKNKQSQEETVEKKKEAYLKKPANDIENLEEITKEGKNI